MHASTAGLIAGLTFLALLGGLALKIQEDGGPPRLFLGFIGIAFGPSLVYAWLTDESSKVLLGGSVAVALVVAAVGFARHLHNRRDAGE